LEGVRAGQGGREGGREEGREGGREGGKDLVFNAVSGERICRI